MEVWREELYHEGTPKHSGRFPWGSGENPFHHTGRKLRKLGKLTEKREQEKKAVANSNKGSGSKNLSKEKKVIDESNEVSKSLSNVAKSVADKKRAEAKRDIDLSEMTDDELRSVITRHNLEKQYKEIAVADTKVGADRVADTLKIVGDVLVVTSSVVGLASAIKDLKSK